MKFLVILGLPIMMAAMRLVLSLVAVVGDAGSRGSSGCEACVGLSARGCLDALGAALAALGDGSRVMVLETVLAGSDRCDGADLAIVVAAAAIFILGVGGAVVAGLAVRRRRPSTHEDPEELAKVIPS